jgi:hypothetical protein
LGRATTIFTLPSDHRTVTTPPWLEIVRSTDRSEPPLDESAGAAVLRSVVVVDLRVVDVVEFFESDFFFDGLAVVAVVEVGGSGAAPAVVVVDGAGGAAALTKVPAVAPGRGSELAGGAGAGGDADPAEGLAGVASTGGDGGGAAASRVAVSGEAGAGAATSPAGTDRAACSARRTSGRDIGCTPAVAKRDETS